MDKVVITNKINGTEATIERELWDSLDEKAKRPFDVKVVKAPIEVLEMQAKASETETPEVKENLTTEETTETAQNSTQTEKDTEATPKKKTRSKKEQNNTGNQ